MKRLLPKLWAKITAYILLVVCAAVFAASAVGVIWMVNQNVYVDGGAQARRELISGRLFRSSMAMAEDYAVQLLQGGSDQQLTGYAQYFDPANTNFGFRVQDAAGALLLERGPISDWQYSDSTAITYIKDPVPVRENLVFDTYQARWAYIERCQQNYENISYNDYDLDADGDGDYECGLEIWYTGGERIAATLTGYVRSNLAAGDGFYTADWWVTRLAGARYGLLALCVLSLVLGLWQFVFLLCAAGRREGETGVRLGWQDKLPLELYLLVWIFALWVGVEATGNYAYYALELALAGGAAAAGLAAVTMPLFMTLSVRLKAGRWWETTLCWLVGRGLWRLGVRAARLMPLYWRAALGWCLLSFVEFICIAAWGEGELALAWLIEKLALTALGVLVLENTQRLRQAGRALAAGEMDHPLNLERMLPELRRHGEDLDSIQGGIQRAVEAQMKSERLKTELITNVSHDIKTPLTAIVSYVDLLQRAEGDPEKTKEYLAVLARQSARLKKLTEDLVEASKASSGSVTVALETVDAALLLRQAAGEYEGRFEARRLEPVLGIQTEPLWALADGKLLWRVLDNLLSNAAKYALEGTRVYLSAEQAGERVLVTMKNISAQSLNISSDELLERFVRGDAARSTEGSGLGLSIARSLTELMGGDFRLTIDGDLFKAEVSLPCSE